MGLRVGDAHLDQAILEHLKLHLDPPVACLRDKHTSIRKMKFLLPLLAAATAVSALPSKRQDSSVCTEIRERVPW